MIRRPAVAGSFYSDDGETLRREVSAFLHHSAAKEHAVGIIAPHAGYIYSGAVAGAVYGAVNVPRRVVILGPNHHGAGNRAALSPADHWLTPLGPVAVDHDFGRLISRHAPLVATDSIAHSLEHSLEVQVPFLQMLRDDVSIVPICLGFGDYLSCQTLGTALARAVAEDGRETLIVASSDMTHYESAAAAKTKDDLALERILALDAEGLLTVCSRLRISMCGVIPATVMLTAARELGATRGRLVRYATSGDVTGDHRQVVAYAGVTVS